MKTRTLITLQAEFQFDIEKEFCAVRYLPKSKNLSFILSLFCAVWNEAREYKWKGHQT
jgi:hypothetical protein